MVAWLSVSVPPWSLSLVLSLSIQSNLCDVGEEACDCGVRVDRERKRATAAAEDVAAAMLNRMPAWHGRRGKRGRQGEGSLRAQKNRWTATA